jgi:undecaprenyl diphosphate synthase
MLRSTLAVPPGLHVAIVMDGNGRWATARGHSRPTGHVEGARTVRRTVECARAMGVSVLTLYAFSSDNWRRPAREVGHLMRLFRRYLASETERCIANDIRLTIIGRRDRLSDALRRAIDAAEEATADCRAMRLRVALDYSARDSILEAASKAPQGFALSRDAFARLLGDAMHDPEPTLDVDLLIRTGCEQRLSDFLLWECAYAELLFTQRMWPEFTVADFEAAVHDFLTRDRRFGALTAVAG